MPQYFRESDLCEMAERGAAVPAKALELTEALLSRRYSSDRAKEHAHHGVARRISTLARCIDQIYAILPPGLEGIPAKGACSDAAIFVQAFVFNTFGALDNLAHIWVGEKDLRGDNGRPLPNSRIGLTDDKAEVRASFSMPLQAYLANLEPWFSYLKSFRHSLGHRIPLYIPPYCVTNANRARYDLLANEMNQALRRWDLKEHERLQAEQLALVFFRPWMQHSFEEAARPVVFHSQVLADFATVEEICLKILEELDSPGP